MRGPVLLAVLALGVVTACGDGESGTAEDLAIRVVLDRADVAPGEAFTLTVERTWPAELEPGPWDDQALAPLVVRPERVACRERGAGVIETRRFRAYAFSLDDVEVPAVTFAARPRSGGEARVVRSNPARVRIHPALDPTAPGAPEFPSGPLAEPIHLSRWMFLVLLALVGAALGLALRRENGARQADASMTEPPEPEPTPRDDALARLGRVAARSADDPDAIRADAAEISDVVRDYIGACWGYIARNRTTEEILRAPEIGRFLEGAPRALLEAVLRPCDFVKFADREPTARERTEILEAAEAFVRASTPTDEGGAS